MTTFTDVPFKLFYAESAVFFKATLDRAAVTPEQADAGVKGMGLLYLGQSPDWTDYERDKAVIMLRLASKRCMEVHLANM
jgi:hypothetical protein